MKKIIIFSSITMSVILALASCGVQTSPKAVKLANTVDSLNYTLGYFNGSQIKQQNLLKDTTDQAIESFLQGISDALAAKDKGEDSKDGQIVGLANQVGMTLAQQNEKGLMNDSTLKVDYNLIRQGLVNGLDGSNIQMTGEEAMAYVESVMALRQFKGNKEAGEKFLAENAKKDSIKVTASGLQYKILKEGTGKVPTDTSVVSVNYRGTLINGTEFDSSKEPIDFTANQVIKGWTEALKLMPVGSKWMLYIPQELAYGQQGNRGIEPFSALVFEVELVSIK